MSHRRLSLLTTVHFQRGHTMAVTVTEVMEVVGHIN